MTQIEVLIFFLVSHEFVFYFKLLNFNILDYLYRIGIYVHCPLQLFIEFKKTSYLNPPWAEGVQGANNTPPWRTFAIAKIAGQVSMCN